MQTPNKAERLAIAKALSLIEYFDESPPGSSMCSFKESPEFQAAAEAIRRVAKQCLDTAKEIE